VEQGIPPEGAEQETVIQTVAALIPACNAGATVGTVVSGTRLFIDDVLVVDDGSTDDTHERAARAGAVVVGHGSNRGKGEALKTGFRLLVERGFDAVLTLDADGQHDPGYIPDLLARYSRGDAGIVIGSRMAERAKIPRVRLIPNLVGNFFISRASGRPIEDSQCGMRVYSAAVLKTITLVTSRFDTEAEALIKAGKAGFTFAFVPIPAIYRTGIESNFVPVKDTYLISIVYLKSLFWR
jgi:glycosyltransferase involved in cell wall biosynthesis